MTELIQTKDSDTVAFRVKGVLDGDDVQSVAKALDQALKDNERVSLLADLAEWEDMTVRGLFSDLTQSVERLGQTPRFERVGIIGDAKWIERFATVGDAILPGVEVKAFVKDRALEAREWVAGAS